MLFILQPTMHMEMPRSTPAQPQLVAPAAQPLRGDSGMMDVHLQRSKWRP
jgi:hypothetical protein